MDRKQLELAGLAVAIGAAVALFRSIVDGKRRTLLVLVAGCAFGALGGWIAWTLTGPDERLAWLAVVGGALVAENIAVGIWKLAEQFREDPRTFSEWITGIVKAFRGGGQ